VTVLVLVALAHVDDVELGEAAVQLVHIQQRQRLGLKSRGLPGLEPALEVSRDGEAGLLQDLDGRLRDGLGLGVDHRRHVLAKGHLGPVGEVGAIELDVQGTGQVLDGKRLRRAHVQHDRTGGECGVHVWRCHVLAPCSSAFEMSPRLYDLMRA
jgi:hypothetical protein